MKAADREKLEAEMGRKPEGHSLGTAAVPSEKQATKRVPRASAVVTANTGVSRRNVETAENVADASPDLPSSDISGDASRQQAAELIGAYVTRKMATPSSKSQQHTSTQTEPKTLTNEPIDMFDDGVSEFVQLANGVRCHRFSDASMIVSRLLDQTGFIARDNATWRWSIWLDGEDGQAAT